jgi:hypothetical protein
MNQIISKLNSKILEAYGDFFSATRTEALESDVNLFGEWEAEKASHWMNILDNYEFATVSIEKVQETSGRVDYYAPVLVYSNGVEVVKEYNYVD